jgi:hypothetical protein
MTNYLITNKKMENKTENFELKSTSNRIMSDLLKGKKLVRLASGQYCFIVGDKFRPLEHSAINKLMEEKMINKTFALRGITHYQLV